MTSNKSIWFHLGHALERARPGGTGSRTLEAPSSRRASRDRGKSDAGAETSRTSDRAPVPSTDDLMAAGVAVVVDRVLSVWGRRDPPGFTRLVKAGASGAVAALLVDLVRPLLEGRADIPTLDRDTLDHMLAGAGQGLLYGAVLEPRVPGPAILKGALYGSAEYVADPLGGVSGLLGAHAPQRKLPLVGETLHGLEARERAYLEHLIFGITLAILYDPSPSSNGIRPDDEE